MRASSVLKCECGITTASWSAWRPLRTRVRKSAIGSLKLKVLVSRSRLPARLGQAWNVALVGVIAQADAAKAELAHVGARPAALAAAVVLTGLVLGWALLAHPLRSLGHLSLRPRRSRAARPDGHRP